MTLDKTGTRPQRARFEFLCPQSKYFHEIWWVGYVGNELPRGVEWSKREGFTSPKVH